ncbi:MAG: hypothetical protein ACTHMM_06090 [Agriterribacter sp.]
MVSECADVPVCFGNIIIGNCRVRLNDHQVTGMFKVDEEILGGIDFYYQIYPLKGRKLDSIQVNFIPGCNFLMENPEAETTN